MTVAIPARAAERAATRFVVADNGCHVSTYSTSSNGYAQVGWWADGKSHTTTAHRAAWVHHHGQVPDGCDIDHRPSCDRRCVNEEHLRPLTAQDNRRRQRGDWPLGECRRGHPDSARVKRKRGLICRLCHNEQNQESYQRKQAVA